MLLIEAGVEDRGSPFFKLPLAALGFQATPHHWGYETEDEAQLVMRGKHWEPMDGCAGRPLIQTRGKVVGGSSTVNLCNYVRGHPSEYDAWAEEHGAAGFSYAELLPYFKKAEALAGPKAVDDEYWPKWLDAPARGHAPAIFVERLRGAHALSLGFVQAARRWLGAPSTAPSHVLTAPSEGAALHWVSIRNGMRSSNSTLLHGPAAAAAIADGRLRVATGCRALRVLLEDGRAVGVTARTRQGAVVDLRAAREVVLSAGAINSPQLLLLSGVGPAAELEEADVTPLVDRPGVGKGLRDLAAVGVSSGRRWRTRRPMPLAARPT